MVLTHDFGFSGNVGQVYTLKFTLGSLVHTAALGHTSDGVNWARWNTNEPNRFKRWKSYYPEKDGPLTGLWLVNLTNYV